MSLMTRREFWTFIAITTALALVTLAVTLTAGAQTMGSSTAPPVNVAVRESTDWAAILTAAGVIITAIFTGLVSLQQVRIQKNLGTVHDGVMKVEHATNSLLDARVAAEHAVGQMAERDAVRLAAGRVGEMAPGERPPTLAEVTAAISAAVAVETAKNMKLEMEGLRAEVRRLTEPKTP